jgi:hypothetical protein
VHRYYSLLLVFVLLIAAPDVSAQMLGTSSGTIVFPGPLEEGKIKLALGVMVGKPPGDVVEESSSARLPLLEGLMLYGLPANFQIDVKLATMIMTNNLALGARWVFDMHPLAFAAGYEFSFLLGWYNTDLFNNSVRGRFRGPSLAVGYDFGDFSVTVKGELSYLTSLTTYTDDIEIENDKNLFNGGTVTLYVEQPLWKDNYFIIGIRNNFIKYYYPIWQGFPTVDRYYYVPEFLFGIRL